MIGIQPDIVTLGKPMGNGFPVAAVVASQETVGGFRKRFKYFNTFGGNPVAMAAAQATLAVIEEEGLVNHAYTIGHIALNRLKDLVAKYDCLGQARGSGLFFGAEVRDQKGNPDPETTRMIVNAMRKKGVLINSLGKHQSLLKIRPPLPINIAEIDFLINSLEEVLVDLEKYRN